MVCSSSSLLDTFPAPPPTPPKDLNKDIDDALAFLDTDLTTLRPSGASVLPKPTQDTPPDQSPSSSAEPNNTTSSKRSKRVGFSAWHTYGKAPAFGERDLNRSTPLKSSLPHREPRFLKSILKPRAPPLELRSPTRGSLGNHSRSAHNFESFAAMLESVIHQLAGQARDCRLDAYVTMLGTLKAYEDIPDVKALESKMALFMQFIQRDMCALNTSTQASDTVLTTQALKLLITLMRIPSIMHQLDHAFCKFVIARSIFILSQSDVPKAIVNHHLYVLAQQEFDSRVWTSERAGSVLDALQDIEERVKGNGVIGSRLAVYKKLVDKVPALMVTRITDWLPHVFHGTLSSLNDLRTRAIDAGLSCAMTLGTYPEASKEVIDLLATEIGDGINYGVYLERRLQDMLSCKENGQYVPQIWSVVILFLQSRRHKLSRWRHLKLWLDLIQKCLNAGDMRVKFEGNIAWNRLVFVASPDPTTSPSMINLLRQGIAAQLNRKGNDNYSTQAKQIALSSYNNLLYYAFRPSASASQLDLFWDEYVAKILGDMASLGAKDANTACRVLSALFRSSNSVVWIEDRANQPKAMKPDELPSLDPSWIRQRLSKILKLVSLCIAAASWSSGAEKEAPVPKMWISLVAAVSEASNKEITTSVDTREAIAHVTNFLHCQWSSLPELRDGGDSSLVRFGLLVRTAIERLGPMHFAERVLVQTAQSDFEAAPTPSHRSRNTASLHSPMLHLLELLLSSTSALNTQSCVTLARAIIHPCWSSRNTRQLKIELLRDCVRLVSNANNQEEMRYTANRPQSLPHSDRSNGHPKSGPASAPLGDPGGVAASDSSGLMVLSRIWQVLAELTEITLRDSISKEGEPPSNGLIHEYQAVNEVLGTGLPFSDYQSLSAAKTLHNSLIEIIGREVGDGAITLAVTEPLAARVVAVQSGIDHNGSLIYGAFILGQVRHPRSRRDLERARKALSGESIGAVQKPAEFDPYDSLYSMITGLSSKSYLKMHRVDPDMIVCFLSELARYITNCPLPLLGILLRKTQAGIALWIEDGERKLKNNAGGCHELSKAVIDLWKSITSAIEILPRKDSVLLKALETLILAGFRSRRQAIVDPAVTLWNATFGLEQSLEYSSSIARAVRRLRATFELQLPNFPADGEDEEAINDSLQSLSPQDGEEGTRLESDRRPSLSASARQLTPGNYKHHNFEAHFAAVQSSPISEVVIDSQELLQHNVEGNIEAPHPRDTLVDVGPQTPLRFKDRKALGRFTINPDSPVASIYEGSTTPRLPVPLDGAMDDVPSSSPTPASVPRRQILSDDTEMATSGTVRSVRFDALPGDPPSSPPALEDVSQENNHDPGHASFKSNHTIPSTGSAHSPVPPRNATTLPVSANKDYGSNIVLSSANSQLPAAHLATEALACQEQLRAEVAAEHESPLAVQDVSFSSRVEQTPIETVNSDVFVDARSEHVSEDSTEEADVFIDASQVPLPPSTDSENETEYNKPRPVPEATTIVLMTAREAKLDKSSPVQQRMAAEAEQTHLPPVERVLNSFILSDRSNTSRDPSRVTTSDPGNMGDQSRKRGQPSMDSGRSGKRSKKQPSSQPESLSLRLPSQYTENEEEILECIVVASQSTGQTPEPSPRRIKPEPSPSPTKSRRSAPPSASKPQSSRVPDSAAVADSQPVPGAFSSRKRLLQISGSTASPAEDTPGPKRRKVRSQQQRDTPHATRSSTSDLDDLTGQLAYTRVLSHVEIRTPSSRIPPMAQRPERQDVVAHDDVPSDDVQPVDDETTVVPPETPATPSRGIMATGAGASSPSREDAVTVSNPPTPSSGRLGRTILHPRSILERLKKILTDCQQMVLGSQEEREIDDALFEVRKEVHEAGRRGRGS